MRYEIEKIIKESHIYVPKLDEPFLSSLAIEIESWHNSEMRRVLEGLKLSDEVFNKTSMGKEMAYEIIVNRIDKELEGVK